MSNALTIQQDRQKLIEVLESSLYPGAQSRSIEMVLGYCEAAGLDPMLKPVHIVPMWDNKQGRMRDVVMPGVGLYRTQASRTGQFAGMTEPEFGPEVTQTIGGQQITFPEWCRVTVRRILPSGVVAEFTAREYWMENYAAKGGKEKSITPNAMWTKRPRGQIAKCASAQALRIAFPELGAAPTADEMEGKEFQPQDAAGNRTQPAVVAQAKQIAAAAAPAECPASLLSAAEDAALRGVGAYQEFWRAASKVDRQMLSAYHDGLKLAAKEADEARTVEAPASAAADADGVIDDEFAAAMGEPA